MCVIAVAMYCTAAAQCLSWALGQGHWRHPRHGHVCSISGQLFVVARYTDALHPFMFTRIMRSFTNENTHQATCNLQFRAPFNLQAAYRANLGERRTPSTPSCGKCFDVHEECLSEHGKRRSSIPSRTMFVVLRMNLRPTPLRYTTTRTTQHLLSSKLLRLPSLRTSLVHKPPSGASLLILNLPLRTNLRYGLKMRMNSGSPATTAGRWDEATGTTTM